jgi:hypothetical protein
MLHVIGASSVDDLFTDVPEAARLTGAIHDLPDHASELAWSASSAHWPGATSLQARCLSLSAAAPIVITSRRASTISSSAANS